MEIAATRPNLMDINLDALAHNLALVRRMAGAGVGIIASVKANAYGHGIVAVGRRLATEGVEVLATGSFADAVQMRAAGIETPILLMGGALPAAMPELLRHRLIPTVHSEEHAEAVAAATDRRTAVYIKVDCGFGRLGLPLREAHRLIARIACHPRLEVAGLYTHLPFSDEAGRDWARERIARFDALVASLKRDGIEIPITQARASAALLTGITDTCTAVSPGGALYGLAPVKSVTAAAAGLRPVMEAVLTRLIQVSPWAADLTPGFEGRHAARVTGATGVVPFGRVDGNRAPLPDRGAHMLIDGVKAPILGVSLEHAVLDLSAVPGAHVGQAVVVLGRSGPLAITIEDIARWQGIGDNDVLMLLNGRVPMRTRP